MNFLVLLLLLLRLLVSAGTTIFRWALIVASFLVIFVILGLLILVVLRVVVFRRRRRQRHIGVIGQNFGVIQLVIVLALAIFGFFGGASTEATHFPLEHLFDFCSRIDSVFGPLRTGIPHVIVSTHLKTGAL